MKSTRYILLALLLGSWLTGSCSRQQTQQSPEQFVAAPAALAWLPGSWVMQRKDSSLLVENWQQVAEGSWEAAVYRVQEADSSLSERLSLQLEGNRGELQADAVQNDDIVRFALTMRRDSLLRFENPMHDFPKQIEYKLLPNGTLRASISDESRTIVFDYQRYTQVPL